MTNVPEEQSRFEASSTIDNSREIPSDDNQVDERAQKAVEAMRKSFIQIIASIVYQYNLPSDKNSHSDLASSESTPKTKTKEGK